MTSEPAGNRRLIFYAVYQVTKKTILDQFRPTIPLLILPTLHLILCFVLDFTITDDDGLWVWVLAFFVDFPLSTVLSRSGFVDPFLPFAIFGTLWWYLISVFLRWIFGVGASIANR